MLKLQNIVKQYKTGDTVVDALRGVSLEFRENEFVSILGQSGCGKTTLLNIIGGLDRYTSGDLFINGKSTKLYRDRDWDNYRNHTIGFVFQTYNLIPHQTVLANVELALTLSGVSKHERRKRAVAVLEKVGLGDQINKKPNQMSGGQMQRVAIARALINNPDILLADEPTGALDSETSVQIMQLLKEIAEDKLVIMVTHNPELAEEYSTRIIKLFDGKVVDDSMPYVSEENEEETKDKKKESNSKKEKKPSMSFFTALSLSLNNLLTKKTRTLLTSFAGSIGIIGIALILSLSSGVEAYITRVEEETLSSYPLTIEQSGMDMNGLANSLMGEKNANFDRNAKKIYSNNIMTEMMSSMINELTTNNLEEFKKFLDSNKEIKDYTSDIIYNYSTTLNVYSQDGKQINPSQVFNTIYEAFGKENSGSGMMSSPMANTEIWSQMLDNKELLNNQYEVLAGKWPENYNEVVVLVNKNNQISDYALYSLGLRDTAELKEMFKTIANQTGEKVEPFEETSYSFDDILNLRFKLLLNSDYFEKDKNGLWVDKTKDNLFIQTKLANAQEIKVVGIIRPSEDAVNEQTSGMVFYTRELMEKLINDVNNSEIVKQQKSDETIDVFTGKPFENNFENMDFAMLKQYIATLPEAEQQQYNAYIEQLSAQNLSEEEITKKFVEAIEKQADLSSYDKNLTIMGVSDLAKPKSIHIYPKDFEAKDSIARIIEDYNKGTTEENKITYTDYIGLMMSSVTTIVNAISYILIAFVSISLIVSSIMIGIITYISVLERTKEIGILRAMGASKKDISRVFNAETLIVGFSAGALGILVTLLMLIPINIIIKSLTDIANLALLPTGGAIILVIISMLLTFIAGLIPSRIAAKKDPVTSLRTE